MYYERNGESYLIFDHDMDQKTIPFEGWLHNCIFCQAITANEEDFEHDQLKVKILSCYLIFQLVLLYFLLLQKER